VTPRKHEIQRREEKRREEKRREEKRGEEKRREEKRREEKRRTSCWREARYHNSAPVRLCVEFPQIVQLVDKGRTEVAMGVPGKFSPTRKTQKDIRIFGLCTTPLHDLNTILKRVQQGNDPIILHELAKKGEVGPTAASAGR
jgi:hypothetical protein